MIRDVISEFFLKKILESSIEARPESHPDLVKPFHEMCQRNGISEIPKIMISKSWPGAMAIECKNMILVGESYLRFVFKPESYPAILAHETAHILKRDKSSDKGNEYSSDRIAAQLLGSKDSVVAMLNEMNAVPRMQHETLLRERVYGTEAERMENITSFKIPEDCKDLDALILKHNQRFSQQEQSSWGDRVMGPGESMARGHK